MRTTSTIIFIAIALSINAYAQEDVAPEDDVDFHLSPEDLAAVQTAAKKAKLASEPAFAQEGDETTDFSMDKTNMKGKAGWHRWRPHVHWPHRWNPVQDAERAAKHLKRAAEAVGRDVIGPMGKGLGNALGGVWKGLKNTAVKAAQHLKRTAENVAAWAEEVAKKALPFLSCLAGVNLDCMAEAAGRAVSSGVIDIGCPDCLTIDKLASLSEGGDLYTYEKGKYLTAKEELLLLDKQERGELGPKPRSPQAYAEMLQVFENYEPEEDIHLENDITDMRMFVQEVKKDYIARGQPEIADTISWSPEENDDEDLLQIVGDDDDNKDVFQPKKLTVKESDATTATIGGTNNVLTEWSTKHKESSLVQDATQGAGFSFKKELLGRKLTLEASAKLKGCFFVLANFGSKEIGFGMKNAGVELVFGAKFKFAKGRSKSTTKLYKMTDGRRVCRNPSGRSCRPEKLFKKMVMIGPIPLLVAIFAQLQAAITLDASFTGSVDLGATYRHELKFDQLSIKYSNGGLRPHVKISSHPSMTQTHHVTGSGSATATLKLGPKIFVTVNAVPFSVWPVVKFILKASITRTISNTDAEAARNHASRRRHRHRRHRHHRHRHRHRRYRHRHRRGWGRRGWGRRGRRLMQVKDKKAAPDAIVPADQGVLAQTTVRAKRNSNRRPGQTRRRRGSTNKKTTETRTCVEGNIAAGGTTTVSVPSPADTADMICRAAVKFTCNNPMVNAANCIAKGFGVDPCAEAGNMCSSMSSAISGALPNVRAASFSVETPQVRAFHTCSDKDRQL